MKKSLIINVLILIGTAGFIITSCEKEDEVLVATNLKLISGENQTIVMNSPLPEPVIMIVTDQNGQPISGTTVYFTVNEGSVEPTSAHSDANGKVSAVWTVGKTENNQVLIVTAFKEDGVTALIGSPVTVTATSLIPSKIELVSGGNQNTVLGNTLADKIVVKVLDQNGNPFLGAKVRFSANDNSFVSHPVDTTDSDGKAETYWVLGTTTITQTLTVNAFKADGVTALAGSPLTIIPRIASSINLVSGDDQTGEILCLLDKPIIVQVKDQNGAALAGIAVAFEEPLPIAGDMYIPLFTVYDTTDAEGKATHRWKLQNEETLPAQRKLDIIIVNADSAKAAGTQMITAKATATPLSTSVMDAEGNSYNILPYGNQVWMTSNLKTTKYNDDLLIPNITEKADWLGEVNGAYCWFNNDISYRDQCGALYNWYAVETEKLCPSGWHVPSDEDWQGLINYLISNGYGYGGSGTDIAKAMASKTGWTIVSGTITHAGEVANDISSNNSSGFSAYPTGYRILDVDGVTGTYDFMLNNSNTSYWTSDDIGTNVWGKRASGTYSMGSYQSTVDKSSSPHYTGNSVRCIRD